MGGAKGLNELRVFLSEKKKYVISRLDNLDIIEEEKIISSNLKSWHLTFAYKDFPEKTFFSKENLNDFKSEVIFSNYMIDKMVGIALNEYVEYNVEYQGRGIKNIIEDELCSDKHKMPFSFFELTEPTKITWETYALPNFFSSPQLGKKAHFTFLVNGGSGPVLDSSIEFRINHRRNKEGEDFFKPLYLINNTINETFSEDVLVFLENEVRHGYSINYEHIR